MWRRFVLSKVPKSLTAPPFCVRNGRPVAATIALISSPFPNIAKKLTAIPHSPHLPRPCSVSGALPTLALVRLGFATMARAMPVRPCLGAMGGSRVPRAAGIASRGVARAPASVLLGSPPMPAPAGRTAGSAGLSRMPLGLGSSFVGLREKTGPQTGVIAHAESAGRDYEVFLFWPNLAVLPALFRPSSCNPAYLITKK